jgi:hypothetical protein
MTALKEQQVDPLENEDYSAFFHAQCLDTAQKVLRSKKLMKLNSQMLEGLERRYRPV